jgi:hypothetical protein
MNDDFMYKDANNSLEESRRKMIARDAAILVAAGTPREKALVEAEGIFEAQQKALDDVTGTANLLDDAQSPEMPIDHGDRSQVRAIALDLVRGMKSNML